MSVELSATEVDVDPRHLMTVRVVAFELSEGTSDQFDVSFQIESDKTRAVCRVLVKNFGKYPDDPFEEGSDDKMSAYESAQKLKSYDRIKHDSWRIVEATNNTNKSGGGGTHADVTWTDLVTWIQQETEKPSTTATLNI